MRWKLKTTLLIITLICVISARFGYLHNQYDDLRKAGATLHFEWQHPTINKTEITFHQMIENKSTPISMVQQKYSLASKPRTWIQKLSNALISNEPVALQIDAKSISDDLIQTMSNMPQLNSMMLTDATNVTDPVDPDLTELMNTLNKKLPNVDILLENQRGPSLPGGG